MRRTINIDEHSIEVNTSMGWLFIYKNTFGHDVLPDLMPLVEAALSGLAEILGSGSIKGDKSIDPEKALDLMNADALVEMFIKLAGMELTTVLQIFWAMAKNAYRDIPPAEVFYGALDRFPMDEIVPMLFYAIVESSVSSKNAKSLLERMRKQIPSLSTWSQSQESTEG